jgi:protein-S-isoprenylcysteine O-methyltransferase Ste14
VTPSLHDAAIAVAGGSALLRSLAILLLLVARWRSYRGRAIALPSSWADRCTFLEPPLLGVVAVALAWTYEPAAVVTAGALGASLGGASLSLAGWIVIGWAMRAFPTASVGHYVLPEQRLVTRGPYRRIRHPLYLGAFLIWSGLALAFLSVPALALLALYVVPAYLVYMKAEERMMESHFGAAYRLYRGRTGMIVPRLRRAPRVGR